MGRKIYSQKEVDEMEVKAKGLASGIDVKDQWEAWRWLAHTYEECERQLNYLEQCQKEVRQIQKFQEIIKEKLPENGLNQYMSGFENLLPKEKDQDGGQDVSELTILHGAIGKRIAQWKMIKDRIESIRPNIFVIQSFLMLSDISSIEMASIFVGAFMFWGFMYLTGFYSVVMSEGLGITEYLTVEDLVNQGILVLEQVLIAWLIIELIFMLVGWIARRNDEGFEHRIHWFFVKQPLTLALPSLIFITLFTFLWGKWEGNNSLDDFSALTEESAQVATVLDGTILNNVYLVGTTSTTAVFLQVEDWGTRARNAQLKEAAANCSLAAPAPAPESNDDMERCVASHRVLIMDRALVVCHAMGDACLRQDGERSGVRVESLPL